MTKLSPITPPPELRRQWLDNDDFPFVTGTNDLLSITRDRLNSVIDQCAAWAADQELEACCEWLAKYRKPILGEDLKYVRRPKPPGLKEQALKQLRDMDQAGALDCNTDKIRAALEALDD